jgi:hypothetical protein
MRLRPKTFSPVNASGGNELSGLGRDSVCMPDAFASSNLKGAMKTGLWLIGY